MVRNWMRFMTIWLDIKLNIVSIMTALRNKLTNCRLNTLLNVRRQVFIYKDFVLCVYVSPPKTIFIHFIHRCSSAFFSFPFFIILSPITYLFHLSFLPIHIFPTIKSQTYFFFDCQCLSQRFCFFINSICRPSLIMTCASFRFILLPFLSLIICRSIIFSLRQFIADHFSHFPISFLYTRLCLSL